MRTRPSTAILVTLIVATSWAAARTYIPLSESGPAAPLSKSTYIPVRADARPLLPGMRPPGVELLEDALRRKQPRTIGTSTTKAHESIIRNWLRSPAKRAHIKGMYAEALFLQSNPDWGYVRSPNASQNDVYTWIRGRRTPFTAQIKTHGRPDPGIYARDMVKDHRANLFFVPDDHVAGLKNHWRDQIEASKARGQNEDALQASRQMARVRGLGFSSGELDADFSRSARYVLRERQAAYISIGAAMAMTVGPDLWSWASTGSLHPQALSGWARSGAVMGAGATATYSLKYVANGSWRGMWKGNALVGSALVLTDTFFAVQDSGGAGEAFSNPEFYYRLSGNISGTALAFGVGGPVALWTTGLAVETGPFAPAIGGAAGFISGGLAYLAGSIGGESATRSIVQAINPELLIGADKKMVAEVRQELATRIAAIQQPD